MNTNAVLGLAELAADVGHIGGAVCVLLGLILGVMVAGLATSRWSFVVVALLCGSALAIDVEQNSDWIVQQWSGAAWHVEDLNLVRGASTSSDGSVFGDDTAGASVFLDEVGSGSFVQEKSVFKERDWEGGREESAFLDWQGRSWALAEGMQSVFKETDEDRSVFLEREFGKSVFIEDDGRSVFGTGSSGMDDGIKSVFKDKVIGESVFRDWRDESSFNTVVWGAEPVNKSVFKDIDGHSTFTDSDEYSVFRDKYGYSLLSDSDGVSPLTEDAGGGKFMSGKSHFVDQDGLSVFRDRIESATGGALYPSVFLGPGDAEGDWASVFRESPYLAGQTLGFSSLNFYDTNTLKQAGVGHILGSAWDQGEGGRGYLRTLLATETSTVEIAESIGLASNVMDEAQDDAVGEHTKERTRDVIGAAGMDKSDYNFWQDLKDKTDAAKSASDDAMDKMPDADTSAGTLGFAGMKVFGAMTLPTITDNGRWYLRFPSYEGGDFCWTEHVVDFDTMRAEDDDIDEALKVVKTACRIGWVILGITTFIGLAKQSVQLGA